MKITYSICFSFVLRFLLMFSVVGGLLVPRHKAFVTVSTKFDIFIITKISFEASQSLGTSHGRTSGTSRTSEKGFERQ